MSPARPRPRSGTDFPRRPRTAPRRTLTSAYDTWVRSYAGAAADVKGNRTSTPPTSRAGAVVETRERDPLDRFSALRARPNPHDATDPPDRGIAPVLRQE